MSLRPSEKGNLQWWVKIRWGLSPSHLTFPLWIQADGQWCDDLCSTKHSPTLNTTQAAHQMFISLRPQPLHFCGSSFVFGQWPCKQWPSLLYICGSTSLSDFSVHIARWMHWALGVGEETLEVINQGTVFVAVNCWLNLWEVWILPKKYLLTEINRWEGQWSKNSLYGPTFWINGRKTEIRGEWLQRNKKRIYDWICMPYI